MRERVRNKLDIASIGSGGGIFEKTALSRFPAIAAVMESALAGEFLAGGENRQIGVSRGKSRRIRISPYLPMDVRRQISPVSTSGASNTSCCLRLKSRHTSSPPLSNEDAYKRN